MPVRSEPSANYIVTGELTPLVGARVRGEHRHLALVEQFTVLEGELTVKRNERTSILRHGEMAVIEPGVSDIIVFRSPPLTVQRAIFGAPSPIARWRGYRGTYPVLSRMVSAPRT